jgi:hypothetical protein
MTDYKAPLRDIRFVADELWDYDKHYQSLSGTEEVNAELRDAILDEAAKFAELVIAPLRRSGDAALKKPTNSLSKPAGPACQRRRNSVARGSLHHLN